MTTSAPGKCPECGLYWSLLEGKFPTHQSNGLDCPMSGHEPQEWPPAGEHPLDTKYRAEAVASLATSSITVPESALAPDKKRKPRSDRGSKRARHEAGAADGGAIQQAVDRAKGEAAGNNELDGVSEQGLDARQLLRPAPKPRAKRSPRGYIVAGDYESYPSLEAAKAALAVSMEIWEERRVGLEGDPPALIFGRVAKTTYIPAKTTPATVRVERL